MSFVLRQNPGRQRLLRISRSMEAKMGESTEKQPRTGFLKGVKAEFKKIQWPDRQSTFKQSVAVVIISVVVGVIIAILDYVVQYGVNILTSI